MNILWTYSGKGRNVGEEEQHTEIVVTKVRCTNFGSINYCEGTDASEHQVLQSFWSCRSTIEHTDVCTLQRWLSVLPPYSGTMSTQRSIIKEQRSLHTLQVELINTNESISPRNETKPKPTRKRPEKSQWLNSNDRKKDEKKKDEEKREKNLSWRSYLVERSAIDEGTELPPPSCNLYSTQLRVIVRVCSLYKCMSRAHAHAHFTKLSIKSRLRVCCSLRLRWCLTVSHLSLSLSFERLD